MKVLKVLSSVIVVVLLFSVFTGCSGNSSSPTVSTAPVGVTASPGNNQATIAWTAVPGATSYNIYWSTTPGVTPANGTKIAGATSPYILTALTNGSTYYYVLTAVNPIGESAASAQASCTLVPPAAPSGVTATPGNGQVTFTWPAVPSATSYNVYWSTTTGVTPANGTKISGVANPYTQTGLNNGTPYFYVVTAVNGNGESAASSQISATPVLPSPAGVTVTPANGQVTIAWTAVPGATSYNIYWSTTTGVTPANGTPIAGATNPYIQSGLTNGTPYFYVVTALNGSIEFTVSTQMSATPSVTPPPAAPTRVTATPGNGQVSIAWTAVSGATSYNIYWATTTGVTPANGTKIIGVTTPYNHTGRSNGTPYYYVVTAVNGNGESTASSQVAATPVALSGGSFTQADMVGTWNFFKFTAGPGVAAGTEPGWMRGNITIDASGNATFNSMQASTGTVTLPPAGTMTETIDASGVVTEGGINGSGAGNHAVMATNKQLVVGTSTSGTNNRSLRILVKQVGTFSSADISSGTFALNQLSTNGASGGWQFATGTINAAQQITLSSQLDSNGPTTLPPANFITLAITAAGIVTNSGTNAEPTFQGVMTPDKKLIVGTETNIVGGGGGGYKLRIIAIGGQTFTTADLAGTWRYSQLETLPLWEYGTASFSSAGVMTPQSYLDSNGDTTLGSGNTFSVGPTGLITVSAKPSANGVMAFNKNILVVSDTNAPGDFSVTIAVK